MYTGIRTGVKHDSYLCVKPSISMPTNYDIVTVYSVLARKGIDNINQNFLLGIFNQMVLMSTAPKQSARMRVMKSNLHLIFQYASARTLV